MLFRCTRNVATIFLMDDVLEKERRAVARQRADMLIAILKEDGCVIR